MPRSRTAHCLLAVVCSRMCANGCAVLLRDLWEHMFAATPHRFGLAGPIFKVFTIWSNFNHHKDTLFPAGPWLIGQLLLPAQAEASVGIFSHIWSCAHQLNEASGIGWDPFLPHTHQRWHLTLDLATCTMKSWTSTEERARCGLIWSYTDQWFSNSSKGAEGNLQQTVFPFLFICASFFCLICGLIYPSLKIIFLYQASDLI